MSSPTVDVEHRSSEGSAVVEVPEEYSVFTRFEKWAIVAMAAYAAWFSTVSSFIYFPAIQVLSEAFEVSVDKINLAITCYMSVATIAPTLVGNLADAQGRRMAYVVALTLYVAANVTMALVKSYGAHLGLRVIQALAISGTFSIAYGVVTDIASPAERGSYANAVSFAITIAPSIGPILGGVLSYAAGWRWIFGFLSLASGVCLILVILFLPESSRKVVGNGSIKPPRHLLLPVRSLFCHWSKDQHGDEKAARTGWNLANPLRSLAILLRKDNAVIAGAAGLLYLVYTCINASLSVLFIQIYHLNQWQVGLTYLPFGLGGMLSTFFTGKLMDMAYRKVRTKLGLPTDVGRGDDLDTFAVEKARLRVIWAPMTVTCLSVEALGISMHYHPNIAVPLCISFILGLCMQMEFSIYNTLLVDKNHRTPAAAQAASNVVRCTLAAVTVAFLQQLIDKIGVLWTYTFMTGLCIASIGLFVVDCFKGTVWRQESIQKDTGKA